MIRLTDAVTLAVTKLRTRKVRTIVSVATVSMLFAVLVLAVMLVGGVTNSAKRFMTGDLSSRYIAKAQYFRGNLFGTAPPEVQTRATELYNKTVNDKKAEAKRLGVDYDPASEPKPVIADGQGGFRLDDSAPAAVQAYQEYLDKQPGAYDKVTNAAAPFHPKQIFTLKSSVINGQLKRMDGGKEDFNTADPKVNAGLAPDVDKGWRYLDASVTKPFLVDKKYLDAQQNASDMPVIAPYSEAEKALGLKKLASNAPINERLERINYVRQHAATATVTTCYRNSVSQAQVADAQSVAKALEKNKDYQKPPLVYGLPPADSCTAAPITRDTRSNEEKQLLAKQDQFDAAFGKIVSPVQEKITFRIVGISPDPIGYDSFSGIGLLVSTVAGSSLQGNWVVPQDLYDALPDSAKASYARFLEKPNTQSGGAEADEFLVEFTSASDIKSFMSTAGCSGGDCSEKPFVMYFGSNSVLLQDITTGATQILTIVALIIAGIAALIMMGMTGRIISDSRRETAVFRAIGAKRNDIRAIYSTYTFFLSLAVVATSAIIGVAVGLWINNSWSNDATVQAQQTFINADSSLRFDLTGLWTEPLLAIAGLIIITGFVSLLLPLSRNLVRSPIKDMRDDT